MRTTHGAMLVCYQLDHQRYKSHLLGRPPWVEPERNHIDGLLRAGDSSKHDSYEQEGGGAVAESGGSCRMFGAARRRKVWLKPMLE